MTFPMKNNIALIVWGINIMKTARSRFARTATQATTAPIVNVPTSPGKTLEGYALYNRKAMTAPMKGMRMMAPITSFSRAHRKISADVMIREEPASNPLRPANMLTALVQAVTMKGSIKK